MLDHDTDAYYKISHAFVDGQASGKLTRDNILDNITLYWLTATGASAARPHRENGRATAQAAGQTPPPVSLPGCRLLRVPRRDLAGPAQLGRGRLSQPHLLQQARTGRPLRRLGRARTVHRTAGGGPWRQVPAEPVPAAAGSGISASR